jgi:hypothetical protein
VGAKACRSCESEASRKEERFKEDSGQEDNRQEIGAEGSEKYGHASATRRSGWWRIDDQLVTAIPKHSAMLSRTGPVYPISRRNRVPWKS